MKKSLFTLSLLPLLVLTSCGETITSSSSGTSSSSEEIPSHSGTYTEGSEKAKAALASLRKKGHKALVTIETTVYRLSGDPSELGVRIQTQYDYRYSYQNVTAMSEQRTAYYYDVYLNTDSSGNPILDENGDYTFSFVPSHSADDPTYSYFRDEETGCAVTHEISVSNELSTTYMSNYDDSTGIYSPLSYEEVARNPWDYFRSSDLVEDEAGVLHLDLEKADFLVDCYGGSAVNWVSDATITLNEDNEVTALVLTTPDIGEEGRYRRVTSMRIDYSEHGIDQVEDVAPYTNDNPDLEVALSCLDNQTNFKYRRDMVASDSSTGAIQTSATIGYYNELLVYYHHLYENTEESDEINQAMYEADDDYDYMVRYDDEEKIYYAYSYEFAGMDWSWGIVSLSGTQPYTFNSFSEIGPRFGEVSSKVFKKTGDLTYEAERGVLAGVGTYFDNQFAGVHSEALNGGTTKCVLTLNAAKTAIEKVEMAFNFGTWTYSVNFTLSNIGTTTIPSYLVY